MSSDNGRPFTEEQLRQMGSWLRDHPPGNIPTNEELKETITKFVKSWTLPTIVCVFAGAEGVRFNIQFNERVQESHFEILGRELLAMAEIIRNKRLESQLKVQTS